ncbi:MAG: response regulator [Alphaproteobacteria bacterium]|nr:response regulator [Alphaproteobacteria bacterium]
MILPSGMTILIIEDSRAHARLIEIYLQELGCANPTTIVDRGDTACDLLFGRGEYEGRTFPDSLLVFLDLNLPGVHGHDILKEMRERPATSGIPVIVCTSSADPGEERRCLDLGASAFVEKPPSPSLLQETFETLGLAGK